MLDRDVAALLAQLPERGYYFSPFKLILTLAFFWIWWSCGAWIDKDTTKIRSNRDQWNSLVFGTGLIAAAAWLLIPAWWVGMLVFSVLYGSMLTVYIVHRNGRVSPSQTVMTPAHLRRILQPKAETEETVHARDRVKIKSGDGKYAAWPTNPEQHEGYQALQDLMFDALWRRSSDVDVSVTGQQARILYKVDGVVRERDPLPRPLADVVVSQLKKLSGMDPEELRKPQEGRLTATIGAGGSSDKKMDVLLKAVGSTAGQRLQMRLLSAESRMRVNELGFTKTQLAAIEPLVDRQQGLILCCGPKESGLSSMLYAMIRAHDAFMWNVHTMETAKLMDIENVTQHVYDSKAGQVTFGRALQSVFRTDPDIVMVGECADRETAVHSADYGASKKVYLGMNAGSTIEGLRKYLQLVEDNALAAKGLLAVIAGRLVRKLCNNCRKGYRPDAALLKKANLPQDQNRPFYRPPNRSEVETDKQGNPIICPVCQGSGYLGRVGVFELLIVDDAVRGLVEQGGSLQAIKSLARKAQMLYLQEVGLQKVYDGVTSINEVLRVTKDEDSAAPAAVG